MVGPIDAGCTSRTPALFAVGLNLRFDFFHRQRSVTSGDHLPDRVAQFPDALSVQPLAFSPTRRTKRGRLRIVGRSRRFLYFHFDAHAAMGEYVDQGIETELVDLPAE